MAYKIPEMPLDVNIWRNAHSPPPSVSPDVTCKGNLGVGKRILLWSFDVDAAPAPDFYQFQVCHLLVPKLTDIRFNFSTLPGGFDWVEVPAGTGRYYAVRWVEDLGKGFANEHRMALITRTSPLTFPLV